ncbi:alpha/beta hydrolase [Halomonas sp. 707D7]|uniref:alpha/beta hydrolase n=1 Tax=Halomonas sp. 707D7 TaxID=1681044 RepID=UPI00209C7276|nr:alpha/beta hydrolase-fold protein [Halomonas sp. 707D7]MCP1312906.1 alpha/beta hydrolase-fold protein [Halomonas sp. 707D7]
MLERFTSRGFAPLTLALGLLAFWSTPLMAQQHDPARTLGHTVLDEPIQVYRFEQFDVAHGDEARRWRVTLAIPEHPAPAAGFPAVWMLDGNAALMAFDTDLLETLAERPAPPVLVFLGHASELRTDPRRRGDYTFTALDGDDTLPPEQRGGGAEAFLAALERRIRPEVERRVPLAPNQQTLWGHSLGGLFVLYTLYTRPDAFNHYAAASPSLWWHEGALLDAPERVFLAKGVSQPTRVRITLGGAERARDHRHRDLNDPRVQAHLARITSVPADAPPRLAERLAEMANLQASYREFPGLGHGPMLNASLRDALEWGLFTQEVRP